MSGGLFVSLALPFDQRFSDYHQQAKARCLGKFTGFLSHDEYCQTAVTNWKEYE
jgi:hypothetical protein